MKPYTEVLTAVLAELTAMAEVDAVLFFGSVQRGMAQATSDLDLYVVTSGTQYWREGRIQQGVEVELFFNPASKMRERLEQGDAVAIHGFATGELLLDRSGAGAELQALGRRLWEAGPRPLTDWEQKTWRYRLTDLAQDLEDLSPDSPTARMLAGLLVPRALEAYCELHRVWGDKPKRLLARIRELDRELADLAEGFYRNGTSPAMGIVIADRVLAPFGGRIYDYQSSRTNIR